MMTTQKGNSENEHSHSGDLGIGICDFDSSAVGGFCDADFGDLNLDNFGGASIQSSDLGKSYFDEDAQRSHFELTDAESAIVRLVEGKIGGPRGRAAAAKTEKIYITHEDFDEGAERDAFLLIFGYAEHLFGGADKKEFDSNDAKKLKALRFFFCRSTDDLNFEDAVACIDNQIRLDVLRLRFVLEFLLRGWKIPQLPWNTDGLPNRIELMAAQYEGTVGIALAREAWFEPGIEASVLVERVLDGGDEEMRNRIKHAFKDLVISYVLSIADGKVYTTGKNPILELEDKLNDPTVRVRGHLANIYWSRRF